LRGGHVDVRACRRGAAYGQRHHREFLITVAFAFRNLTNCQAALVEMRRVLRPGGMAAILEFSQPANHVFRALYEFYSPHILPMISGAVTRNRDAYPELVRKFPDGTQPTRRAQASET
jgi:demethylmenaquinone methyltransferase/2-methoxy-6-polyprenyl-1,4-benzoquinol methylase